VGPNEAFLKNHGKDAADQENAQYGDLSGEPGLRQALAEDIVKAYQCGTNVSSKVNLLDA
jgi:aspartate/methionine/tyrosine aminotransferase